MKISKRTAVLVLFDIFAIAMAFNLGSFLRTGAFLDFNDPKIVNLLAFHLFVFITSFYVFDLYFPFKYFKRLQTLIDILISSTIAILIVAAGAFWDKTMLMPRLVFLYTAASIIVFVFIGRQIYDALFQTRFLDRKTIIIGTGKLAKEIVDVIRHTPYSGMEIVGIVSETKTDFKKIDDVPILGSLNDLMSLLDWYNATLLVLALDPKKNISESEVMAALFDKHVIVTSAIHLFEKLTGDVPYELFNSHYLVGIINQARSRPYLKVKRIMDVVVGLILLVLFCPILLLASAVLAFSGPDRILFIQKRIGKEGVPFKLFKLRSMSPRRKGKPQVTRFGAMLRKYRIDEIPQLINVIKGDMSLVGPRPEIPYFAAKCRNRIPFYNAIYTIKPGLTGWAQVNFKYTKSMKDYDRKFRYNLYYLKNISFVLDLMICFKTIRTVVFGKGQ